MKHDKRLSMRISAPLLSKAQEIARQSSETLARVVRAYLEAYASAQPPKTADK